mgnify:CR=1 FL=1
MKKIIILGMNRTGTKLASFIIAKSFNLPNIFLEPFTWDKGINASLSDNWQPQQQLRNRCPIAQEEHRRLKIISTADESSNWLDYLFNEQSWDLIKLIEVGRSELYYKYDENAFYVSLIREPVDFIKSIKGMKPARDAVVEQWKRLIKIENYIDPLPDANNFLSDDLADCARTYYALYSHLKTFSPKNGIKISYNDITSGKLSLKALEEYLKIKITTPITLPLLGSSTKTKLQLSEIEYINRMLMPIYEVFLKKH